MATVFTSHDFENNVTSDNIILRLRLVLGKSTGVVTNTRITHATPSALYAHSPSRYWEDDGKVPIPSRKSCKDIARQLVEDDPGRHINVSYYQINENNVSRATVTGHRTQRCEKISVVWY